MEQSKKKTNKALKWFMAFVVIFLLLVMIIPGTETEVATTDQATDTPPLEPTSPPNWEIDDRAACGDTPGVV